MELLIIFMAKYLIVILVVLAGTFFATQSAPQKKRLFILGLVSFPLTYLIAKLAAHTFFDPRPFVTHHFTPLIPHDPDNGFPSDHALLSFALANLVFAFNKKAGAGFFLLGFLVSLGRVLSGVHSWIDILGSFVIASVCVQVSAAIVKKRME